MLRKENTLWVEKYRPRILENYVTDPTTFALFDRYIREQDLDNLLLAGAPGTGKTTAAKLLVANIKCDYLYINASSERGIDTIRDKVEPFAQTMGMNGLKIVILDEFDGITPISQAAMRPIMEMYSATTRFILTCNYIDKVIAPLHSRINKIHFNGISKNSIAELAINILETEKVTYDLQDLKVIINTHYPDIRKVVRELQRYNVNNVLTLPAEIINTKTSFDYIISELITPTAKSWVNIRQYIADNNIKTYEPIYSFIYEEIGKFKPSAHGNVITSVAEAQFQSSFVIDKEITFMACMANILS